MYLVDLLPHIGVLPPLLEDLTTNKRSGIILIHLLNQITDQTICDNDSVSISAPVVADSIYGNPIALLTTILHKIQFLTLMLLLNTYLQEPIVWMFIKDTLKF